LESFALRLSVRFLVGFIDKERLFELRQNLVREVDVLQNLAETIPELFFAEVG
jgi:hypothetical protein